MAEINISNLSFSYGKERVLENINLHFSEGDFLGIVGSNGGGKSTLLKLILNLIPSPTPLQNTFSSIGYVPQYAIHNPHFPICVFDCVLMGRLKPLGKYSKEDKEIALSSLESVGISHLKDKKLQELSGGQRQKALIARALCTQAPLLILDEPTASLDSASTQSIFSLLDSLHKQGKSIILICHDLDYLLSFSTHIAHIQKSLKFYTLPQDKDKILGDFGCKHHLKGECDA